MLQVTPFFPPDTGGISNHTYNLCMNLSKLETQVKIICPSRLTADTKFEFVNSSMSISRTRSIFLPGWPYQTLRSISIPLDLGACITQALKKNKIDIVHVHGHHYPLSWLAVYYAKKHNVPCVLTLHGTFALNPTILGGRTKYEDLFNKYIFTRILRQTSAIIGLTEGITKYAKQFDHKTTNCYFTIPNGVNTVTFRENLWRKNEYRRKYGIDDDSIIILFSGRFEKVKGILELVRAVAEIEHSSHNKKISFIFLGSGSLESYLRSELGKLNYVHIFKWQPMDTIHELYIASDIFIIPSKFEALPITVVEAMNAGLHIVYTPIGGLPEILQGYNAKTELRDGSSEDIVSKLSHVIQILTSTDYDSLSYAQKFDWVDITAQTLSTYFHIMDGKNS